MGLSGPSKTIIVIPQKIEQPTPAQAPPRSPEKIPAPQREKVPA